MEIIRQFNNGALGIKCAFCEGSCLEPETSLSDERRYPCPVCNGKGFNIFHQNPENLTDCRYCNSTGQGFDKDGSYFLGQTCETCKGSGAIIINFDFSDIEEFDSKNFHSEVIRHSRSFSLINNGFTVFLKH